MQGLPTYIIHHPTGLFDPGAREVAGTDGLVEGRQQTVQCVVCSHDPQGQLKPNGAFQYISLSAIGDHQRSRRHGSWGQWRLNDVGGQVPVRHEDGQPGVRD